MEDFIKNQGNSLIIKFDLALFVENRYKQKNRKSGKKKYFNFHFPFFFIFKNLKKKKCPPPPQKKKVFSMFLIERNKEIKGINLS